MRHIALIYKYGRPEAARFADEIKTWLEGEFGLVVISRENVGRYTATSENRRIDIPDSTDAVVVLGGDGTLLSVARLLEDRPTPIIGVNLGALGFLTQIQKEACYRDFTTIFDGGYDCEERMRLSVCVMRGNVVTHRYKVLNDAVINKSAIARIVSIKTSIAGRHLTHYRGDGLIVATPTGSTAYNLSAGGPIVYPTAKSIILTPICPFTLTNRPIILPSDITIQVELTEHNKDVTLTCDGQVGCQLTPSDTILVSEADNPLRLIMTPSMDYFEILRSKLNWGQD